MAQNEFGVYPAYSGYNQPQLDIDILIDLETLSKKCTKDNELNVIKALKELGGNYEIRL